MELQAIDPCYEDVFIGFLQSFKDKSLLFTQGYHPPCGKDQEKL
jgi:hypothetical protein